MVNRGLGGGTLLGLLLAGCSPVPAPTSATGTEEALIGRHVEVLNKHAEAINELTAILRTIDADAASKPAAEPRLIALSRKFDDLAKASKALPALSRQAQLQVAELVAPRRSLAMQKLKDQVKRIQELPGGPEYFQKDLRQLIDSLKSS